MQCARCKGNLLCGKIKCPLLQKFRFLRSIEIGNHIDNPTPPSAFVGRIGYPKVYAGSLVALDNTNVEVLDAPWMWKDSIEEVIKRRVSLVRITKRLDVRLASNPDKYLIEVQEATASIKPVEIEAEINKINKKLSFDDTMQPMGFNAIIEKFKIVENPKIPDKVEKIYYDDMRAVDSLKYLKDKGFNTYYLQKLFSVGMFGYKKNRKLVPTRWSITAIHDILGEEIKKEIAVFDDIDKHLVFSFEHFGNHFEVILTPGEYSFQLLEIWIKKSFWSPDKTWIGYDEESITKKKGYSVLGGGYYAARLPVLEWLQKVKKKASILVIREIKPEYYAPLGVWVVEEGVRRATSQKPEIFENFEEALSMASNRILTDKKLWEKYLGKYKQSTLLSFM
ncbi:hypothetical protein DRO97_03000 [Archaeoglobales archaeon]|nr:MAG: hypothetical protein DRO97_03000 [Archaeoglobales archaeon]